ncbi:YHYH domain-containing protein [Bacillus sp. 31A1R]|uniref:YHYH domain-containing protein n=1 Tax=Robertmurraya mangrovi TaxID=3098077 RepID=A0ABU5IZV4_9BACI|nr:YHYH domain-containing protein [Bacillus sp. 31A1R]MDZ5472700.1 YHYH domain-containing protein [Bacillus sp. 31A1R]
MKRLVGLFFLLWCGWVGGVEAHPGNTDASGGHTCRTNCEEWGLNDGEYHYHDGYSDYDSGGTYDEGYATGFDYAYSYTSTCEKDYEWWWEGSQEFGNGYEEGIADGHEEGLEVCIEDSEDAGYQEGYDDYQYDEEYDSEPPYGDYLEEVYKQAYVKGWEAAEQDDPMIITL